MNVHVFTNPNCQQCDATKRRLTKEGIPYEEAPLSERPNALAYAKEQGWTTAPVVLVFSEYGEIVEGWSGFRPDKIKALAQREG